MWSTYEERGKRREDLFSSFHYGRVSFHHANMSNRLLLLRIEPQLLICN